jgi:hypothetical protein
MLANLLTRNSTQSVSNPLLAFTTSFSYFDVRRLKLSERLRCGMTRRAPCSGLRGCFLSFQVRLIKSIFKGRTTTVSEIAIPMAP